MTAQFLFADLVKDTSSAQSSTTITLSGSPGTGFQSFNAGIGDGNYTIYKVSDTSGNWEVNYGVYTNTGKTLGRYSTPLSSSNAGAQVATFSGTVTVACVDPAPYLNGDIGLAGVGLGMYRPMFLNSQTTITLSTGTVYWTPIWIKQWFSSVILHLNIATLNATAGAVMGLGLYNNNAGNPGTLLNHQDSLNCSTTGGHTGDNTTSSLSMPTPQPPGIYWVAFYCLTGSPSMEVIQGTGGIGGFEIIGQSSSSPSTTLFYGYSQGSLSAFPTPPGTLTPVGSGGVPAISVQASF